MEKIKLPEDNSTLRFTHELVELSTSNLLYSNIDNINSLKKIILVSAHNSSANHLTTEFKKLNFNIQNIYYDELNWQIENNHIKLTDIQKLKENLAPVIADNTETLILFLGIENNSILDCTPTWNKTLPPTMYGIFTFIKALKLLFPNPINIKLCSLGNKQNDIINGALHGFSSALAREWPGLNITSIVLHNKYNEIDIKLLLLSILNFPNHHGLVLKSNNLYMRSLVYGEDIKANNHPVSIPPNSVIIVAGGGKGITAKLSISLAKKYKGLKLIILGKTEVKNISDTELKLHHPDICTSKSTIESLGSEFIYYSVDMTDGIEVEKILIKIKSRFGKINGYIHGVGITDDSLISVKSLESFTKVFQTKTNSLPIIYQQLKSEPLFFVTFLSSLSSLTGVAGQTDYSAANNALNAVASEWNSQVSYPVTSMLWSVWGETGIGKNIWQGMRQLNLDVINVEEGTNLFLSEIENGKKTPEWILFSPLSTLLFTLQTTLNKGDTL